MPGAASAPSRPPERSVARGSAPAAARRRARQSRRPRRRRDEQRGVRGDVADQRGGEQRADREDALRQHTVQRERALQQVRAVAEQHGVLRADHGRGRRERGAGDRRAGHSGTACASGPASATIPPRPPRVDEGQRGHHAAAPGVDEPGGERGGDARPERERPGGGAGDRERAGLRAQEEHDREAVDADRQPREQRGREHRADVGRAEDLQIAAHSACHITNAAGEHRNRGGAARGAAPRRQLPQESFSLTRPTTPDGSFATTPVGSFGRPAASRSFWRPPRCPPAQ